MPYEHIRTNITPSPTHIALYGSSGDIDTSTDDWYGYDLEMAATPPIIPEWQAMFFYPLPLDYNPYQPDRQGYNNANNVNHYLPNNPFGPGFADTHVNFNGANSLDYEYEPIGFYKQKVFNTSRQLQGNVDGPDNDAFDFSDIRMADRRTMTVIEPSVAGGDDYFRTGTEHQVDNYSIFGRRTIIMDVLPSPMDTDPLSGTDDYGPSDERDGGATAINPYPVSKGPDNKFQLESEYGTKGKMVTVQVFWMPRNADKAYIPWRDINKIELKTFIAADNEGSNLAANVGTLGRNDLLFITPPN